MSSPPRLKLPDGLELRPAAPAMPTATVPHSAAKSRLSLQTSQPAALPLTAKLPAIRQSIAVQPTTRQPVAVQPTTATRPPTVQPVTKQQVAAHPTTIKPAAAQTTTSQPVAAQPSPQPAALHITSYTAAVQPTRQPPAVQPTARQPAPEQPTARQPAPVQQTTRQPTPEQPTARQPAPVQQTTRQLTTLHPATRQLTAILPTRQLIALQPTRQPAAVQPTTRQPASVQPTTTQPVSHPVTTQTVLSSGRRDIEPVPKKRRLLEATEVADGHEMTKTGTKQGDAEDILARVCLAVGIDSDLVESVVEDPPPGHHSAVVGSTHSVPGHLQYLRGMRPPHPAIPPAHRLRRPELRFHSSMHPAYRVSPDGSYALAEVRHPYHQYHYRPHDPAYVVQNHIPVHPGEPHHYRPFPHHINRYQCVGPVSQPMNRPPMLRPGPPIGSSDRRLPVPHSSPTLPQPGEIRHYPTPALRHSPPGPPSLHHDPRRVPPVVHHIHHKVPGIKHIPPGHSEIPYGIPTSRHDSSSVPEHPAATATSRSLTSCQRSPRPGLQEGSDQQKQHAGLREVYIPATPVSAHRPQGSPYSIHPYQGHGQYHHLYPRVSESYSKLPYSSRAEQDTTSSRAPMISLQPSPDKRLQTVPVRSSYIPEQSRDQTWGVRRPSDDKDRPPEIIQMRRTMEPPKPCVELIPIGPLRDARERKSVGEDSHNAGSVTQKQSVAAPDRRQVKTSSSQHTQLLERTRVNADQKVLIATHGHAAQRQNLAAYVAQPACLPDNRLGRLPMTSTANPEFLLLTKDHPGVFRRPLSSDPSSSRGETSASETQKAHRYNRCNSEPTNTHSRTFDEKSETNEKKTDSRFSTHKRISNVNDTEKHTTTPQTRSEERVSQSELDHIKTKEERIFTSDGDVTVERVDHSKNHNGDLKHSAQQGERSQETYHRTDIEKTEREVRSEGPGQHNLHSYVNHHRPASEPPLGLIPATSEAFSSRKRPASLPSAGQHNPTTIRCHNDLAKLIFQHQENSTFSENPTETENDKVFMERLKLVLNDLLSVPEATKLQQLSCSTEQLLASVVQRGGATPSEEPSPRKRLREDFKTVVKLCLPATLLKYWGWDLCTPDQILDQLIKVTQNGDDGVNGRVISTPSSPLTHDDNILEDDVFSPPPCSAPRPFIPEPYAHTTPVPEPPHDRISHAPHARSTQPCAYTSTTYTKHHHIPVSYVPAANVMPSHSPHSIPARTTSLNSNVVTHCPSDPNGAQVYTTGGGEHACSKPGKNANPPPPHHDQHTAVKWPGSNSVVGSPVCTPVIDKAPAT